MKLSVIVDKKENIGYNNVYVCEHVRRGERMGYKKSVFRSLAMVSQLGLCVLTPVLLGIFAGSYLDSRYGTKTVLIFLILGILGGGRGAYLMAKRLIEQEAREEERARREQMEKTLAEADVVSRPKRASRVRGLAGRDAAGGAGGGMAGYIRGQQGSTGEGAE